jgi:hypothetical protein
MQTKSAYDLKILLTGPNSQHFDRSMDSSERMIPYYYILVLSIIADTRSWNGLINAIVIQEN